jgi:hypothetical protein
VMTTNATGTARPGAGASSYEQQTENALQKPG